MIQSKAKKIRRQLTFVAGLLVCLFFVFFPFAWMLSTSLKSISEIWSRHPTWIPKNPIFRNYLDIWKMYPLGRYFLNSAIVALTTSICAVILASLAAYGFSRFNFKGKKTGLIFILMTQMFPEALIIVPYFIILVKLKLYDTYPGLIIVYTCLILPFSVWILYGYFKNIPIEIEESAILDGCSRLGIFYHVILPLGMPGISATIIYSCLLAWNEYIFALCFTASWEMYTVPVGIASFMAQYRIPWNHTMAAGIVSILPVLILFLFLEKYLIKGLTAGAIKE